jgi:hypothetical protein
MRRLISRSSDVVQNVGSVALAIFVVAGLLWEIVPDALQGGWPWLVRTLHAVVLTLLALVVGLSFSCFALALFAMAVGSAVIYVTFGVEKVVGCCGIAPGDRRKAPEQDTSVVPSPAPRGRGDEASAV